MEATRKSTTIALILLMTFSPAVDVTAKTASEIFEKVSASVVVVQVYNEKGKAIGFGSGVVLPGGDVATNYHVVEKATKIKVHKGEKDYDAVIRYSDRDRDVCSLSAPGMKAAAVAEGSTKTLKVGSRVYAIGTPQGLELTLSEGIISSLRPVEGGQYLQITAPISPGSSGGGLFDEEGRLIGLTTFYLAEGQQLNFAVPVEWIRDLPTRRKKEAKPAETYVNWLNKAEALKEKTDWAGLINHAIRWTNAAPLDVDAWYTLGDAYYESSQFAKAIDAYQQALRIKPEDANAWCNLGFAYGESGQFAKAIDAWQQALRISPEDAIAWRNLGVAYYESGYLTKAIEAYQQALRIKPEYPAAWRNLGVAYYESSQFTKAIDAYQEALRIKPQDPNAWYSLGVAYGKSGQRGQVMAVYKRLKTLDPALAEKFFNNVVLP
jgi:tetratricopeptide (TPR) repeat protein